MTDSIVEHEALLRQDIRRLGNILGQVICLQAGPRIFGLEERIRILAKSRRSHNDTQTDAELTKLIDSLSLADNEAIARAFTLYFELINLAEEHHRVRVLRKRERQANQVPQHESIPEAIATLSQMGVHESDMAQILARLQVELVVTAHPTEAKRRTVLSKLRRIANSLDALEIPGLLSHEENKLLAKIQAEVTSLWTTERNRTSKPTVNDEIRTRLWHFYATLWDTVPQIYESLAEALARYYPNLPVPTRFLTFGSWVGGDRDGNPFVTTEATAEALQRYRQLAAERHARVARSLSRSLSMSNRLVQPDEAMRTLLEGYQAAMSSHVGYLSRRYPSETYRLVAAQLADGLNQAHDDQIAPRLLGQTDAPPPALRRGEDVLKPVQVMTASLRATGLGSIVTAELAEFCHQIEVFGLHTARLDIRQYSSQHHEVLAEVLGRLGYSERYQTFSGPERTEYLTALLQQPPPNLADLAELSTEAAETLKLFAMLRRVLAFYGPESLGPYVVSMTQGPDDILVVLLLAYWHGLCLAPDQPREGLTFAPLFETLSDLRAAPDIMSALFTHPSYRQHLNRLNNQQMVMIGYSDSNKDAGYIAAKWELFCAQELISERCRTHQIDLTLFHGRGGTIARGGGPTNQAILAQPANSVREKIRITEQGEVLDERYGHPGIARRHLEQMVHAVLMASAPGHEAKTTPLDKWRTTMKELAEYGHRAYRSLVYETPEFLTYWQQATPIREINQLQIGSRPSRRTSSDALATLRAIPWVFSWMQSRYVLPGWYGLGTALSDYAAPHHDRLEHLKEMYQNWPFFTVAIDNAQVSLGKADMGIARLYAELVTDPAIRTSVFSTIEAEFLRTQAMILEITGQSKLLDKERRLQQSIRLRNPYVDPLNFIQVSFIRKLRALPEPEGPEGKPILQAIFLTINGVATGLKNTG
jgi:phosphoenolpyruvate carboxylase